MPEHTLAPSQLPTESDPVTALDSEPDPDPDPVETLDAGECPWCDAGGFTDAHQHARMAHANQYDAATEAE